MLQAAVSTHIVSPLADFPPMTREMEQWPTKVHCMLQVQQNALSSPIEGGTQPVVEFVV